MTVLWESQDSHETAILTKESGETVRLRIGDFITYKGRPDGVRIDGFTQKPSDPRGPIGLIYLPWRKETSRWATIAFTLKGNPRHLIAFPCGAEHYGEQVVWESVELLNDGICPDDTVRLEEYYSKKRSNERSSTVQEELISAVWHPSRMEQYLETGGFDLINRL